MTDREKELHSRAWNEVKKHKEQVASDPYRQSYHLMPPVGLLNDPNGWIQWKGTYHMFFQWNPFETAHGSKFWGHYSSEDMVNWKEEPIALAPSEWYEKDGCYSGSAVDNDGELILFYTGNVKGDDGRRYSYQCKAVSSDGVRFRKEGPVIDERPQGYTTHFRDPKVWHENDVWYLVIGVQTRSRHGQVLLYESEDLTHWQFRGPLAGSGLGSLKSFGYMWECPDMFHLDGKDVLIVSPQGLEPEGIHYQNTYQAGYFIGEADLETPAFHHGGFQELDHGFEFYAPQTTIDDKGRRILSGWMGVPDQDEEFHPTITYNWIHCLTVPRELCVEKGRIVQRPVSELQALRTGRVTHSEVTIGEEPVEMEGISGKSLELFIEFSGRPGGIFECSFRNEARIIWNAETALLTLERKNMKTKLTEQRHVRTELLNDIRVFVDHSSLEMFINGGETVMTSRFFPDPSNEQIMFRSSVPTLVSAEKWAL